MTKFLERLPRDWLNLIKWLNVCLAIWWSIMKWWVWLSFSFCSLLPFSKGRSFSLVLVFGLVGGLMFVFGDFEVAALTSFFNLVFCIWSRVLFLLKNLLFKYIHLVVQPAFYFPSSLRLYSSVFWVVFILIVGVICVVWILFLLDLGVSVLFKI